MVIIQSANKVSPGTSLVSLKSQESLPDRNTAAFHYLISFILLLEGNSIKTFGVLMHVSLESILVLKLKALGLLKSCDYTFLSYVERKKCTVTSVRKKI